MRSDTIKTIAGLLIIVLIVVGTYLYGNSRRQSQLRHDAQVKQQQQQAANKQTAAQSTANQPKTTPVPTKSAPVAATPTPSTIPDTGASTEIFIPVAALGALGFMLRRSRKAVYVAVRADRMSDR